MTKTYKVAGQVAPAGDLLTLLYTVPAGVSFIASTLLSVNRDSTGAASAIRIAVVPSGEIVSEKHYIEYDRLIESRGSIKLTLGISLAAGDGIYVYANTDSVSFSLFGVELS